MTKTALVTGANGRLAHGLIPALKEKGYTIIGLDVVDIDLELTKLLDGHIKGSVLNYELVATILEHDFENIFHFASTLAVTSELDPEEAHRTNASGTVSILSASLAQSEKTGHIPKIIFPSSLAVYGIPDVKTKESIVVTEDEYVNPQTIYGITKLYCEQLGVYYSDRYKLIGEKPKGAIDFRALRLPGIVTEFESSEDMSKFAGLTMVHSPAEGGGFEVYVKENTVLPFIKLPDAVRAFIALAEAPKEKLKTRIYNVSGFASSVKELSDSINSQFPDSSVSENFDPKRQSIVDSWPQAIDDSKAREDWGWK
jgi:threonine 3-dehydrogenase